MCLSRKFNKLKKSAGKLNYKARGTSKKKQAQNELFSQKNAKIAFSNKLKQKSAIDLKKSNPQNISKNKPKKQANFD